MLWSSFFNYISLRSELSPLITLSPSSAHLLKQICSNGVAKMLLVFLNIERGHFSPASNVCLEGSFLSLVNFSNYIDLGKPLPLCWSEVE